MSRTYTVACLSEAASPITHMSGSEGNVSIVAREAVVTPRGLSMVPYLSGNAIRHRAIREPGMRWLIGEYALAGKLSLPQLNFLLHGGAITDGGARVDTARAVEFGRLFPLGRLLGGCLPDQVIDGSLHCWRGTLICEENRGLIGLPAESVPSRLRPAEAFVSGYQYTRADAAKSAGELAGPGAPGACPSNLMIFSGQAVAAGAAFAHGFVLRHANPVELGALLWSLRLWQAAGGTLGGQAARGHGRLACSLIGIEAGEADESCRRYVEHAREARSEAVAWLDRSFTPPAGKARKAGKVAS